MGFTRFVMKQGWKIAKQGDADRIAKQMPVTEVYVESCIPYTESGDKMHQLNLYYPQGYSVQKDGKLPTVIDIHGGGLMYGDKELNQRYCEYLASKGYCVMNMSYRLLPDTDLQGMVQDIFASIHWLAMYGPKRGFDLSKVLLTGDSAGGHLASLTMCIQNSDKLQNIYQVKKLPFDFSAVVISNGVCEMHDYFNYPKSLNRHVDKEIVKMILGKQKADAPWKSYMNFSQVMKETNEFPHILIIGTENDVFYHQTCWIMENLANQKIPYEKILWKKEDGIHLGHVFHISHWEWKESKITNDKMLEFFQNILKQKGGE